MNERGAAATTPRPPARQAGPKQGPTERPHHPSGCDKATRHKDQRSASD